MNVGKKLKLFALAVIFTFSLSVASPKKSEAASCCSCEIVLAELTAQKIWYVNIFWEDNILPALMLMAEQLTAVAFQQTQIIGSFLDAKHQLETQQLFGKLKARIHKDYHPSIGMCDIGTNIKSLAASDRKVELNAVVMSQRSLDRNLGNAFTAAAAGASSDKSSRIKQFREKFCDPRDNNSGLDYMCQHDQDGTPLPLPGTASDPIGAWDFNPPPSMGNEPLPDGGRMNKDIDYVSLVDFPWTLDVDFTNQSLSDEEEELLALGSNLYSHEVFFRPPSFTLKSKNKEAITSMQKTYMDMRSVLAKRSVAENSFNAITSMKSSGADGSREFLIGVLKELGVLSKTYGDPEPFAEEMIGDKPSYYAQMEILTKKIFQNPDFYTNLYDKPANVDRKGVALQAIGLMQKFDLFKSYLRNEASLSVLLELAVMELQEEIENEINPQKSGGDKAEN